MSGSREACPGDREEGDGAEYVFEPNEEFVKTIVAMGVSRSTAVKALYYTGNKSADLAASWIFENPNADLMSDPTVEVISTSDEDEMEDVYKMVFLVNMSLQMGVGKTAAQVAHAALGMHRLMLQDENKYGDMLLHWEEFGETKIVLKVESTEQLISYENKAQSIGMPTYVVRDAGRTQIAANSATVLAIMGKIDIVDQVTGSLKLL